MNLLAAALAFFLALLFTLVGATRVGAWLIERRHPPVGAFAEVNGARLHYVHVPAPPGADLPPVVFLHGASGNLLDQMLPVRPLLEGRAEMLFLDRPGHGWSTRGRSGNDSPARQAETVVALMDRLGIGRAVIVGHSFGGAATAILGADHPDRVAGLVFLAAATHPWPGRAISWHYRLAAAPLVGRLFTEAATLPAGWTRLNPAVACVFAPNRAPADYVRRASIPLVLRPSAFRANARDVMGLYDFVTEAAPRYRAIRAPTVVVTGDRDTVVFEEVHSLGLARDIPHAELVWVENLGHKPDWVAPELTAAAIEKVAGLPRDLQALARAVEGRIKDDRWGVERCRDLPAPAGELAPG